MIFLGGRYRNPDETPFFPDNLPSSLLPLRDYPQIFHPASASVCVNKDICNMYINEFLPLFVMVMMALSRRIHYGKYVAEVKFRDAPQDYSLLIRAQDKDGLMELLTFVEVEEMVKKRVAKKALIIGQTVNTEVVSYCTSNASCFNHTCSYCTSNDYCFNYACSNCTSNDYCFNYNCSYCTSNSFSYCVFPVSGSKSND